MAQANVVSITSTYDRKHSESFRELEADICDIDAMAALAVREAEGVLDGSRETPCGDAGYERAMFALSHLRKMVADFKRGYYAQFEAPRTVARSA